MQDLSRTGDHAGDTMLEGLYKVSFHAGDENGASICLFKDSRIVGGGMVMYYIGTYTVTDDNHFIAEMDAQRHARKEVPSPVLGLDSFHLTMEGVYSGPYVQVVGKISEVPEARFLAHMTRLADF